MRVIRQGLTVDEAKAVLTAGGLVRHPRSQGGFYLHAINNRLYGRFPGSPKVYSVAATIDTIDLPDWEEVVNDGGS